MGQRVQRVRIASAQPLQAPSPKLLDRVRAAIRTRHYSIRTEEAYVGWVRRFILFHNKRHPAEMGESEINQFLTHLAVAENVAASTQNQALSGILFLYQEVLGRDLDRIEGVVRAKKPKRLPVVLTRDEVRTLLAKMSGTETCRSFALRGWPVAVGSAALACQRHRFWVPDRSRCAMAKGKRIASRCCRPQPQGCWLITCSRSEGFTRQTSVKAMVVYTCRAPWPRNIPLQTGSGVGLAQPKLSASPTCHSPLVTRHCTGVLSPADKLL